MDSAVQFYDEGLFGGRQYWSAQVDNVKTTIIHIFYHKIDTLNPSYQYLASRINSLKTLPMYN